MSTAALDRDAIGRAAELAGEGPILVALSGGGDSTALLHLLVETLGASRVRALVVDHALRDASADEARRAAGFAQALGVGADILTLSWPDGPKRNQAAARRARYAALCDAARKLGARVVATGHNADDQAETLMLRAASDSSWRGLAGMRALAPAPLWPEGRGVWLVRPLLHARRADLRAALRDRGAAWIDDPSNGNDAFARVRMRARLAALEAAGFDPMRLPALAARLRPLVDGVDAEAAQIAGSASWDGGTAVIAASAWRGSVEARRRALSALIAAVAGADREIGAEAVASIEAALFEGFRGATLGGAVLRPTKAGARLERDRGAVAGRAGVSALAPLSLPLKEEVVWDGRLALSAAEVGWIAEPDDSGGPVLTKTGVTLPLEDAVLRGAVRARWLNQDRLAHAFGVHPVVTASVP